MVSVDDVKRIVTALEPNTTMLYWVDRTTPPDHYCVIIPHDRDSLRSDNGVEDKTCICSIHRYTISKTDTVFEAIFDTLVAEGASVRDPVYDFMDPDLKQEARDNAKKYFYHYIIDVLGVRV